MSCREEDGAATVLVLVLVAVLGAVALAGAIAGGVLVGQRRAASAADLAALAGAETFSSRGGSASAGADACRVAGAVSERNGAKLTACLVESQTVLVDVAVEVPTLFGARWSVPGRARAGPSEQPAAGPRHVASEQPAAESRHEAPGSGARSGRGPGAAKAGTLGGATASGGPAP
jgi:secretion/DNA translocation related TadE-like protein